MKKNGIEKTIFIMVLTLSMFGCGKNEGGNQFWQTENEEIEEYKIDSVVSEISEGRVWVS